MTFHVPEKFRVTTGFMASTIEARNNGAFQCKLKNGQEIRTIAGQGMGWEHVSVSFPNRCPTWDEMCEVKALFWDAEDCIVQYHPPESKYVNCHPYCLHLWKPIGIALPIPTTIMV